VQLAGRRIQIAGSANEATDEELITYGHNLVEQLVKTLATQGATFVVGVGREPLARPDDATSPALVFYWTALENLHACLIEGSTIATGPQGPIIAVVATSKTDLQIPDHRRGLWDELRTMGALMLRFVPPGWTSGANRRVEQAAVGDVLIALSGGEGVEHLALLYRLSEKPVIPIDLDLGGSSGNVLGSAVRLSARALAVPESFARFSDPAAAPLLFSNLTTRQGRRSVSEVAQAVVDLVEGLAAPTVFYVRLLDRKAESIGAVDRFFRNVVDPVVAEFGYEPLEMGQGKSRHAWMNEAIFEGLHYSPVTIVDLTDLRSNCFMELGYALGQSKRVLITAMHGTRLPFDASMLEYYAWTDDTADTTRQEELRAYWERNINRPPIVRPRWLL
jgi:TIR- and PNP-associating SLOG family